MQTSREPFFPRISGIRCHPFVITCYALSDNLFVNSLITGLPKPLRFLVEN